MLRLRLGPAVGARDRERGPAARQRDRARSSASRSAPTPSSRSRSSVRRLSRLPGAAPGDRARSPATRCSRSRPSTSPPTPTSGGARRSRAAPTRSRSTVDGDRPRQGDVQQPRPARERRSRPPSAAAATAARSRRSVSERRTDRVERGARVARRRHVARGFLARRRRRDDGGHRRRPGRPRDQAGRGRGLPLLRPHLHHRLLPASSAGMPRIDSPRVTRCAPTTASRSTTSAGRSTAAASRSTSDGKPLRDPDGRPLPPAPRTKVCDETAREYDIGTHGRRRLVPLLRRARSASSSTAARCSDKRINGDAALEGYCYQGRKVFCVMYYQTKVPVLSASRAPEVALARRRPARRRDRHLVALRLLDDRDDRPDRPHGRAARRRSPRARRSRRRARRRRRRPSACWRSLGELVHGAGGELAYVVAAAIASLAAVARGAGRADRPADPPPAARALAAGDADARRRGPLRRAARARLHDLRPHVRRLGAGGDRRSPSATRRSGSPSGSRSGSAARCRSSLLAPARRPRRSGDRGDRADGRAARGPTAASGSATRSRSSRAAAALIGDRCRRGAAKIEQRPRGRPGGRGRARSSSSAPTAAA